MTFRTHLILASIVLCLAIWLSSGTMTPYGSTWAYPVVTQPCQYLYNQDHLQYRAAFDMLDGQPRGRWEWCLFLRRLLYPLVAYPFMKIAGFETGGFIASLLINLAALVALAYFLRKRWGDRVAVVGAWLMATYPGITYWAPLPYPHAVIFPVSCGLFILLARLSEQSDLRQVALNSLGMGLLFTAYDLMPFFGVAAMIILARQRRWRAIPVSAACMAVAPLIVWLFVTRALHLPWTNANSDIYGVMLGAYLHPTAIGVWLRGIAAFPIVLVQVFVFSNMVFLPTLFLLLLLIVRRRPTPVEGALAIAVGLLFAFNNLAPPYPDTYEMRGEYIPRIYQPLGVAMIVYAARVIGGLDTSDRGKSIMVKGLFAFALVANLSIAFGPIARVPWTGTVYQRFYVHSYLETMDTNLAKYGRRPLGFCRKN